MRGGRDLHGKGDGRIKPMAMHARIRILPAAPFDGKPIHHIGPRAG